MTLNPSLTAGFNRGKKAAGTGNQVAEQGERAPEWGRVPGDVRGRSSTGPSSRVPEWLIKRPLHSTLSMGSLGCDSQRIVLWVSMTRTHRCGPGKRGLGILKTASYTLWLCTGRSLVVHLQSRVGTFASQHPQLLLLQPGSSLQIPILRKNSGGSHLHISMN